MSGSRARFAFMVQAKVDLKQQSEALQRERELMQKMAVADIDIVNLNVGGTLLSTKRSTLTQVSALLHLCAHS